MLPLTSPAWALLVVLWRFARRFPQSPPEVTGTEPVAGAPVVQHGAYLELPVWVAVGYEYAGPLSQLAMLALRELERADAVELEVWPGGTVSRIRSTSEKPCSIHSNGCVGEWQFRITPEGRRVLKLGLSLDGVPFPDFPA